MKPRSSNIPFQGVEGVLCPSQKTEHLHPGSQGSPTIKIIPSAPNTLLLQNHLQKGLEHKGIVHWNCWWLVNPYVEISWSFRFCRPWIINGLSLELQGSPFRQHLRHGVLNCPWVVTWEPWARKPQHRSILGGDGMFFRPFPWCVKLKMICRKILIQPMANL